jgi:invasion protein IalB
MRKTVLLATMLLMAGTAPLLAQTPPGPGKKFGDWAVACRQVKEDGRNAVFCSRTSSCDKAVNGC